MDDVLRDEVMQLVARYLRGELSPRAFSDRLNGLFRSEDERSARDESRLAERRELMQVFDHHDLHSGRQLPLDQASWERYRRELAFLRSGLPRRQEPTAALLPRPFWKSALLSLVSFASLAALVLAWRHSWLAYCLTCVALVARFGFSFVAVDYLCPGLFADSRETPESAQQRAYWPFANEDEWKRHEPLLHEFRLPDWEGYAWLRRVDKFEEREGPSLLVQGFGIAFGILLAAIFMPFLLIGAGLSGFESKQDEAQAQS